MLTVRDDGQLLGGLNGRALEPRDFPSLRDVKAAIPGHCFQRSTWRAMKHAVLDVLYILGCGAAGAYFIPFTLSAWPLWTLYALVTGTVATGAWVLAHECGHGAFSDNKKLQSAVGYFLHSVLLVPYYSWQRSHAVHHRYTNHMTLGETHVPKHAGNCLEDIARNICTRLFGNRWGQRVFGQFQLVSHLLVGWPAYLLFGVTGGPAYGTTNHFVHFPLDLKEPEKRLFPGAWRPKVYKSSAGTLTMMAFLAYAIRTWGFGPVFALYFGPLLVTNAWLVLYTWLQHTDVDVPHFADDQHTFMKGALHTIDRPYNRLFFGVVDWLHHRIGTTHVVHHIDCTIPFYHAREATAAVRKTFPDVYLYDDTPIYKALWRVAKHCCSVKQKGDMYLFA